MEVEKVIKILERELRMKPKKIGTNFFFVCPFHNDKNPSLGFETKNMFFNCFGCNFKAKNVYDFWSKYKRISFDETLDEFINLGYIKKR
jgi:DNA primase